MKIDRPTSWSIIILILSLVFLSHKSCQDQNFILRYVWKTIEFDYPSKVVRNEAISQGEYIPNKVLILDADHDGKQYFITTPPFLNGTPATLSTVKKIKGRNVLKPFPSWPDRTNNKAFCRGPSSVCRIYIDKCNLLWVLDSGRFDILNTYSAICPPKLLIYDLNDGNREILRYKFPKTVIRGNSLLIAIITESYEKDCSDSIAYIADDQAYQLIVFDYAKKQCWSVNNKLFYPYPDDGTIKVNGVCLENMDGIVGMAIGPPWFNFHSFSSLRESRVHLSVLKNQTMLQDLVVQRTAFIRSPGTRAGQSTVEVMTDDLILIYALIPTNEIACWNSRKPFTLRNQHVLIKDDENFQFISGMKLKNNALIITSNRFQNIATGNINGTDYKYRVIEIKNVDLLLRDSPCNPDFRDYKSRISHMYNYP